jgi:hypothetical protein
MREMTKKEAVERLQKVVGKRLTATDPAKWNVGGMLQALNGGDPIETEEVRIGYCTIVVDGHTSVVGNITEPDCVNNLGGTFSLTPPGDTDGSGGIG